MNEKLNARQEVISYIRENKEHSFKNLMEHFKNDEPIALEIIDNVFFYSILLNENKTIPNEVCRANAGSGQWLVKHNEDFQEEYELILEATR